MLNEEFRIKISFYDSNSRIIFVSDVMCVEVPNSPKGPFIFYGVGGAGEIW